jgi:hypothetical protein
MKKLSLIFALLAVAVGTLFVVKAKAGGEVNLIAYYGYTSDVLDPIERIEPSNYVLVSTSAPGQTENCANGSEYLCGVYTNGNGTHPYITPNSQLEYALEDNSSMFGVIWYQPSEQ